MSSISNNGKKFFDLSFQRFTCKRPYTLEVGNILGNNGMQKPYWVAWNVKFKKYERIVFIAVWAEIFSQYLRKPLDNSTTGFEYLNWSFLQRSVNLHVLVGGCILEHFQVCFYKQTTSIFTVGHYCTHTCVSLYYQHFVGSWFSTHSQ